MNFRDEMMALLAKAKQRSEDPEFQAKAAALEAGEEPPEVKRRNAYQRMGIPKEFWDEFARWGDAADACGIVDEFWTSDERILLLRGECGLGKTYAAARKLSQVGGRFVYARDIAAAFGEEDEGWLADLRLCRLLVIDELGREALDAKGWAYSKLYDVINRRQAELRKTILCTNLDATEFKARYCPDGRSDPLYDRIVNRGRVPRPLTGASMRAAP